MIWRITCSVLVCLVLSGCSAAVSRLVLEEQLLEADRAFSDASLEEGPAAAFADFLDPNAVGLPNDGPPIVGRDRIAQFLSEDPDMTVEWKPETAQLSAAGDLGYTWGRVTATVPVANGESLTVHGKYMAVWRREPSGRWRVIGYMNNRSPSLE